MDLSERLNQDIKSSMRSGDNLRRDVLRLLVSALHYEEIEKGRPLNTSETTQFLHRQARQRKDSIQAFEKGNRKDLVEREASELTILQAYLPPQKSREEIFDIAMLVIEELDPIGPGDKGRVMGALMPRLSGTADGELVNSVVTEILSRNLIR